MKVSIKELVKYAEDNPKNNNLVDFVQRYCSEERPGVDPITMGRSYCWMVKLQWIFSFALGILVVLGLFFGRRELFLGSGAVSLVVFGAALMQCYYRADIKHMHQFVEAVNAVRSAFGQELEDMLVVQQSVLCQFARQNIEKLYREYRQYHDSSHEHSAAVGTWARNEPCPLYAVEADYRNLYRQARRLYPMILPILVRQQHQVASATSSTTEEQSSDPKPRYPITDEDLIPVSV